MRNYDLLNLNCPAFFVFSFSLSCSLCRGHSIWHGSSAAGSGSYRTGTYTNRHPRTYTYVHIQSHTRIFARTRAADRIVQVYLHKRTPTHLQMFVHTRTYTHTHTTLTYLLAHSHVRNAHTYATHTHTHIHMHTRSKHTWAQAHTCTYARSIFIRAVTLFEQRTT